MGKFDTLDDYILRCDKILEDKDVENAKILQDEIIGVFSHEIEKITNHLDNYDHYGPDGRSIDYIGDIVKLRAKLINYKDNLEFELSKSVIHKAGQTININQHNSNTANLSLNITFEQVIETITKMENSILSAEEKELLQGKLMSIERLKKSGADKKEVWEKAKGVIGWILDKGVDVGIASLPYIIQALK